MQDCPGLLLGACPEHAGCGVPHAGDIRPGDSPVGQPPPTGGSRLTLLSPRIATQSLGPGSSFPLPFTN